MYIYTRLCRLPRGEGLRTIQCKLSFLGKEDMIGRASVIGGTGPLPHQGPPSWEQGGPEKGLHRG